MSDKLVNVKKCKDDEVALYCPHCDRELAFIPKDRVDMKWNFIKFICACGAETSIVSLLKGVKEKKQLGEGTKELER